MKKEDINLTEDEYIDVDFQDNMVYNKRINGKPIFYTIRQVGEILEEPSSRIRYWSDSFDDFLQIQRSGLNRKYTEQNIEQLRYIRKLLKEDKLTIRQVQEYCSEQDPETFIQNMQRKDPIAIDVLASALLSKINEDITNMQENIISSITNNVIDKLSQSLELHNQSLQQAKLDLQEYIATTVTDTIDKQLNTNKEEIQSTIQQSQQTLSDTINNQFKEHDVELTNSLKHILEERKEKLEQEQQSKNKGFFSRLLKK